jgi:hypothetical protein
LGTGDCIDINDQILKFAKSKRIRPEEFSRFRDKLLNSLRKVGLSTTEIDIEKYKEVAKCQNKEQNQQQKSED